MQLRDIPPLRTLPKTIEAAYYNRVRLALLRLGCPLRIEMPRLQMDMLLDRQAWIGLAVWQEDLPLLAWTEFENQERAALHEPVRCRLHLYHFQAGLVMGVALDNLDRLLCKRLANQ